ncbi:MAG: hypothetical protein ABFD90_18760 [Phycisphaerales bacterium]
MGRKKPASWKATRNDTPAEKARHRYRPLLGLFLPIACDRLLDCLGYGSRGLSYILWAVFAIWALGYACKYEWPERWKKRLNPGTFFVVGAIVIALLLVAGYMWMPRGPSNADILKELMTHLSEIENSQESRLNREYPLGFVMIALSGHRKAIVPRADLFETDWNKMIVFHHTDNMIYLKIPYLRDTRTNSLHTECSMAVYPVPGSSCRTGFGVGMLMELQCVAAQPVGVFVVLGFKEVPPEVKEK